MIQRPPFRLCMYGSLSLGFVLWLPLLFRALCGAISRLREERLTTSFPCVVDKVACLDGFDQHRTVILFKCIADMFFFDRVISKKALTMLVVGQSVHTQLQDSSDTQRAHLYRGWCLINPVESFFPIGLRMGRFPCGRIAWTLIKGSIYYLGFFFHWMNVCCL
ncbi:hypothetical protein BDA99DRAFT_179463 [Phascolomyces articulosus]|uniref:Uncharacterized protein n=1 Tax=Phascolomyces articulosus TaxID=60185 RepID=A0AAD5JT37_9FUNG|nr:hypothetical protein BDA99DRAFT_179463 [Phascolomyces articulosus]